MHKFLRAIGFADITKEELDELLQDVIDKPNFYKIAEDSEGNEFAEMVKEYGEFFGLAVRGTYDEDEEFHMEYYYPYMCGNIISTYERPDIERHAEKESYAGICDEIRVGVSLIFYLQNVADYLLEKSNPVYRVQRKGVVLAALSTSGKILFPINKDPKKHDHFEKQKRERNNLMAAARDGDESAIENLTLEDIDTYSLLSRRIMSEDIMSIVENYFMPYGIESDQYSVLGDITDCKLLYNKCSRQNVYVLELMCNDMPFSICISKQDLLGEPAVGRRFKGTVWLQGSIFYQD